MKQEDEKFKWFTSLDLGFIVFYTSHKSSDFASAFMVGVKHGKSSASACELLNMCNKSYYWYHPTLTGINILSTAWWWKVFKMQKSAQVYFKEQ